MIFYYAIGYYISIQYNHTKRQLFKYISKCVKMKIVIALLICSYSYN